ncbi:hypothetical protein SAMN05660900_01877 [Megasphaera cerevisiae DSM 20462]|jgi:succinate dehydrogenase hydrophobic anchor subunit|nr:hypothetical protein SAMN05660900_01877 [Megasphaera cerevisiae DSM 20462]
MDILLYVSGIVAVLLLIFYFYVLMKGDEQ